MSDEQLEQRIREAEANPSDPAGWIVASSALVRAGRWDEAQEAGLRAAEVDPRAAVRCLVESRAPLAVLPSDEGLSALVAASPTRVAALRELPFVAQPPPALHPERRVVAGFDGERAGVGVWDLEVDDGPRWFELPAAERPLRGHAVGFCGRALYVGTNGERLLVRDLDDLDAGWNEVDLPGERFRWGKAIDAFVLDGQRLIAVDDMILPKYCFVLDVSEPLRPVFQRVSTLGAHYTYEHVNGAALGASHLAVLSAGGGMGGAYTFLAFYGRDDLEEAFHLAQRVHLPGTAAGARARAWHAVDMAGNLALVAAGVDGLGVFDASQPPAENAQLSYVPGTAEDGAELLRAVALPGRERVLLALGHFDDAQLAQSSWEREHPAIVSYRLLGLDAVRAALG